jgi:hypothetical protein
MSELETVQTVQAVAEGAVVGGAQRVTFMGEEFKVRDRVGLMALMRFAQASASGGDTADMETLAALYRLLRACIHPDDWGRFEDRADETDAEADDLMPVVSDTLSLVTARPTERPAVSSAGPPTTSPSSKQTPPSLASREQELAEIVSISTLLQARSTG